MADQINTKINIDERIAEVVQSVEKLVTSLDKLNTITTRVQSVSQQASKVHSNMSRTTQKATTAMEAFNKSSQDLTKSVQVALGPLSGVAARITAMTALFNRNSFAAAALIGTITGLGVATKKLTRFAIETEVELFRMEAVVQSLGERAAFTTKQLEGMAQTLTRDTLASVSEAREAVTTLATFDNIAPEVFEKAIKSAYAFADVMGGQLAASVRQVGVLLEDPIRNMEMLRRRGIQFTRSERDKIQALMETGRVMEAQNMTLQKFEIFMAQSEAKAKGLAGQLDRTGQLINNFFQDVARQGNVLGGVASQITKVNDALERLLTRDQFIEGWGRVFAFAANAVSAALRMLSENIEALSAIAVPILITMSVTAVTALLRFSATIVGLGKHVMALRNVMFGLGLMFSAIAGPAAMASVIAMGALAGKIAMVAAVIGGVIIGYNLFIRKSAEASEQTRAFAREVDELSNLLLQIPTEFKVTFETNLENIAAEMRRLLRERDKVEARIQEIRDRQTGLVGDAPWKALDFIMGREGVGELTERLKVLDGLIEQQTDVWERWGVAASEAIEAARHGVSSIEFALNNLNQLEAQFLPDIAQLKKQEATLSTLNYILGQIQEKTSIGLAFIDAEWDEEAVLRLIAAVEAGRQTAERAADSWKRLSNSFQDLQFDIEGATNQLLGLEQGLRISPATMRQFEELTSGERSMLAGMGITPQTLTEQQQKLSDINDLAREMTRIQQESMTEAERINAQYENTIRLIGNMTHLTQEQRDVLREIADTNIYEKMVEPLRDLEKQNQEQIKLNGALRKGEIAYRRMRDEIEITNKVEQERLRVMQMQMPNAEEHIKQFETQLRLMAKLREEYDLLNEELNKYKAFAQDLGSVIANSFEDAIVAGNGLRDVLQGLLDDILRITTRVLITKPLETALIGAIGSYSGWSTRNVTPASLGTPSMIPGFANGGIMSSMGSVPLKRYATGGIARTPQLAMFGEGSQPEAYVPLPDGRSIPVTMKGGSNVQVNIINNVGAEVTTNTHEGAHGTTIEVMIDRAVAQKIAERGSDSNRSLRAAFGARNTLTSR